MSKVPKLRFKEFKDAWDFDFIGNVSKVTSGGTPNRNIKQYWDGGNIPWITTSLIDSNVIDKAEEFISEEGVKNSSAKIFPVGTILMAMYGQGKTRGKVSLLGIEATTNQACAAILVNEKLSSLYLFQNLGGRYEEIRGLSNEGGQQNLSGDIIKKIKIRFPSLPEQQKIASFLCAVDEKIQQLTRKKELLEQYKKGVMQQLFSGKLRFEDENGKPYAKWEEKRLGDIGKIRMCKRVFNNETSQTGDVPFYKIGTFGKEADAYITLDHYLSFKEKYPFPKVGEILIAAAGTLGRTVIYDGRPAYFQDSNIVWIENDEKLVTNSFLYFVYQIVKYDSEGGTIQRLYNNIISSAKFSKPSIEEQQKIASFLTALDAKIESVATQIAHTQTFKKGLLQQMFV